MKENKLFKKVFAMVAVMSISTSAVPFTNVVKASSDLYNPVVAFGKPGNAVIANGGTVVYAFDWDDDKGVAKVDLNGKIILNGFKAHVSYKVTKTNILITLSNVKGVSGTNCSISVKEGVAVDTSGKLSKAVTSPTFKLQDPIDNEKPVLSIGTPSASTVNNLGSIKYTVNYSDNVHVSKIDLNNNIVVNGVTGNVSFRQVGKSIEITVSNIKGEKGTQGSITLKTGAAIDASNNKSNSVTSKTFTMNDSPVKPDTIKPVLTIKQVSDLKVLNGGFAQFIVEYSDNKGVEVIDLNGKFILDGFKADLKYVTQENNKILVSLYNIQAKEGTTGKVTIKAGAAKDFSNNYSDAVSADVFTMAKEEVKPEPETKPTVKPTKPTDWIKNPNTGK